MTDTAAAMTPDPREPPHDAHPPISARQVGAAVIGNALEFYDFTTYTFFALQIGQAFFPVRSAFISLMLSLVTFGVGFLLRPVGSLVIGRYADRHGRRPAMLISFGLMGVSILGLGLTPNYATIGLAAPVLVVLWRLCQGFALGAEVGPTTAFLVESAPPGRRGLYAAWQGASQNLASIVGGATGLLLSSLLGAASLDAWGWRLALLLGALVLPFGLILRRDLPETLHRPETVTRHQPAGDSLAAHARVILLGVGLVASATVSTYIMNYMTTYARSTLHMGAAASLAAPMLSGLAGVVAGLGGGWLSDRIGRRWLMIWPRLAFLLAIPPAFLWMVHAHDATSLLVGVFGLNFLSALTTAATFVAINEAVRKPLRGLVFGGIYASSVALFGGTTQLVVTELIHDTGDAMAPAWYCMAFAVVGLVASVMMPETAPGRD